MKRIIIAGTHSGCGKTTVACGLLKALRKRSERVSAFKCGPDYIDPMFHKKIIGVSSHNLDSFFCDDNTLRFLLDKYSGEINVIEGVMGFYDGVDERGSAYSIGKITPAPAIIVVDCKGASESIGAVIKGFLSYRSNNGIRGFIFNRLPERLVGRIEEICAELGTEYLGRLPTCDFSFGSRRLGLITADEYRDFSERVERLGELAEENLRIDRILEISECAPLKYTRLSIPKIKSEKPIKIAVSNDRAFCFMYAENVDLMRDMGCEIEYFSPISDEKLPDDLRGIYLCGGYPELYAEELSANKKMRDSIREAIKKGTPVIAECGGFMYLHKWLRSAENKRFEGVGIIDGEAFETDKLQRFGYVELTAKRDNLLCKKGEKFPAHEFHYWDSTSCGGDFSAEKKNGSRWDCIHADTRCYAGFPHLYFYSDIKTAENFVRECAGFGGVK